MVFAITGLLMNYGENIRECQSSREILEKFLASLKEKSRQPLRDLAVLSGYKSASAMCMVLKGKRGFSSGSAERLSANLKLDKNTARYVCMMANYETAKDSDEKTKCYEELLNLRRRQSTVPMELMQYRFLAYWYYPAIFAMAAGGKLKSEAEPIAKRLGRGITARMVKTAVGDLLGLKLLSLEKGILDQTKGSLKTSDGIKDSAIQRYHRDMLRFGTESLDRPVEERYLSGVTVKIPKALEAEVKKRIFNFCIEINEFVSGSTDGEIFQMNLQLFPLTQSPKEDK